MIEMRTFIVPLEVPAQRVVSAGMAESEPWPDSLDSVRFELLHDSESDQWFDPAIGTQFSSEFVRRRPGQVYEVMMAKRAEAAS